MLKQPFYNLDGVENNFAKLYGENTVAQKERYQNAFEEFKNKYKKIVFAILERRRRTDEEKEKFKPFYDIWDK